MRAILNLALLALLGLQLYVLAVFSTHQHLTLPGFVQAAIERRLQEEGLLVRFGSLEVTLSGRLLLREPKVFLSGSAEPVIEARLLFAEPNWFSLMLGRELSISDLRLAGASLYCPPEVSPSGTRTAMVRNFSFSVKGQGERWWDLEYFRAQLFNADIVADGTFQLPPMPPSKSHASFASQYRQAARAVARIEPALAEIKNPSVKIILSSGEASAVNFRCVVRAEGARLSEANLLLGEGDVRANGAWNGTLLRLNGPATAWLDSVNYTQGSGNVTKTVFASGPVWVNAWLADGPEGALDGRLSRVSLVTAEAKIFGYPVDSVAADGAMTPGAGNATLVAAKISASRGIDVFQASAQLDNFQLGREVNFRLRANFQDVLAEAGVELPARLGSLKFDHPLSLDGRLLLDAGHQPDAVDFTLDTGGAHFDAINLYALHTAGRIDFDTDPATSALRLATMDLQSISLWNESWLAQGSYFHDFRDLDFRLLAHGTIDPRVLDGYIGSWWPGLWQFVVPGKNWPNADVDYSGNWDQPSAENPIYGAVGLAGARARGVLMNDIRLRIYQRHDVVAVFDLVGHDAAGGQLSGAMYWLMKPPYLHTYEQRYIFDSTLPLEDAGKLAGPEVVELLKPVEMPAAPTVHIDQRTGGSANPQPGAISTYLIVHQPSAMHAYRVPLDSLDAEATLYSGLAEIPHFNFGIAGGQARASATLTRLASEDQELAFRATVQGARHSDFLRAIGQFSTGNETAPPAQPPPAPAAAAGPASADSSSLLGGNHKGFLDLAIAGRILLGQPDSLAAQGRAHVYDAELGEIHLFGGFSRALDRVGLSLGSYELHGADADFQIAHQYLRAPNLVITGPSARILAAGTFHFGDNALNFNALVFPLGQIRTPGLAQIASMLDPFANTVTLALTGTAATPNWNASWHFMRMFENQTIEGPSIPNYPAGPDGAPVLPAIPSLPPLPPPPGTPNAAN